MTKKKLQIYSRSVYLIFLLACVTSALIRISNPTLFKSVELIFIIVQAITFFIFLLVFGPIGFKGAFSSLRRSIINLTISGLTNVMLPILFTKLNINDSLVNFIMIINIIILLICFESYYKKLAKTDEKKFNDYLKYLNEVDWDIFPTPKLKKLKNLRLILKFSLIIINNMSLIYLMLGLIGLQIVIYLKLNKEFKNYLNDNRLAQKFNRNNLIEITILCLAAISVISNHPSITFVLILLSDYKLDFIKEDIYSKNYLQHLKDEQLQSQEK